MMRLFGAALAAIVLTGPFQARAAIYSTGVNSDGTLLADGQVDTHWTWGSNGSSVGNPFTGGYLSSYRPSDPATNTAYTPTSYTAYTGTPTAKAIAWSPNNNSGYQEFTFRQNFTGEAGMVLTVSYYGDDDAGLALNGVIEDYAARGVEHTVTLTNIQAGPNILDLVTYNEGGAGAAFADISVPEPMSISVLGFGLAAAAALRRHRATRG